MSNLKPFLRAMDAAFRAAAAALALWCSAGAALAANGFITTNEAKMDAIFSQAGFGSSFIDIRFNTGLTVFDTALLSIDSAAEFDALASLSVFGNRPTVNIFYVDTITFCGGPGSNIVGCGRNAGNLIALNSSFAAGALGGVLAAHELGHTLSLSHLLPDDSGNLMNPTIRSGFALTANQITTILASNLVQMDGAQRFISITPIAVVASVPEPHMWAMMGLGVFGVAAWARRRRGCAG